MADAAPGSPVGVPPPPSRLRLPGVGGFVLYVVAIAFVVWSAGNVDFSFIELIKGVPTMLRKAGEMFPPDLERLWPITKAMFTTFQMAVVGAFGGILISLLLAPFAARSQSPHWTIYYLARGVIALSRTVPDLVWAVFFVISVGFGPFAGTLTIIVDTVGFCGRFFAEAMEEVDEQPQEALAALGAGRTAIVSAAVFPAAMPSFINSSLFSLEKAVRSSVVLGLVGAGGIGIELKASMDMFDYQVAGTIILSIFVMVLVVEQISSYVRRRFI